MSHRVSIFLAVDGGLGDLIVVDAVKIRSIKLKRLGFFALP